MSSTFEMNGSVVYQGRPRHGSKSGDNWCYSIIFLVNTSVPVCDLTISTQDKGGALIPGAIALDPDINPEAPDADDREDGVKDGIRIRRGSHSTGGEGKPRAGTFTPATSQPNARSDGKAENRDWSANDSEQGPLQPGGWRRTKLDGELADPTESSDEMHLDFEPCLQPGEALEITLCFDEQLDENDFIHFTPSNGAGSAIGGGDSTTSETLSIADIIKILGSLAGAGASKLLGSSEKTPNREKRQAYAAQIVKDRKLLKMVQALSPQENGAALSDIVSEHGVAALLKAIGSEAVIKSLGTKVLVKQIKKSGLGDEVKDGLEQA